MRSFAENLTSQIELKKNPTVMGIDPNLDLFPPALLELHKRRQTTDAAFVEAVLFDFGKSLLDEVHDLIPAIKPQIAYYEMYGEAGLRALSKTIAYAKSLGCLVILDAKRNDIGTTAEAYAKAYLGPIFCRDDVNSTWEADALTVNPYFGFEGIKPFADMAAANGKGLFVLVRTSNPSAGDIQDLELKDGRKLYTAMAELLNSWAEQYLDASGNSLLGAVVGATWPEQAQELRAKLPHSFILVPGYGAQGGSADDCVHSFLPGGKSAIVNASRSLIYAWKKHPDSTFAQACRKEALIMQDALNNALNK